MFSMTPMRKSANVNREPFVPVYPLARVNNEFETLFNRFFGGWPVPCEGFAFPETKWGFDIEELDKEFVIYAEAPGFEANEFEIFVNGNVLTLKAEHKVENGEKKGGGFRCERCFERSVTLPAKIKAEKIEAAYKNGILEVHVPKMEETKPRRVIVKT